VYIGIEAEAEDQSESKGVRMNYRKDHIKLLKVFAVALPKKTSFSVADLAKAAFSDIKKQKPDTALDADRACRNALRKPRAFGHIEIVERGEYRLTTEGAALCRKLDSYVVAPDKKTSDKPEKKAKATKVAKTAGAKKPGRPAKVGAKKLGRPAKASSPVAETKVDNEKPVARKKNLIPGLKPKTEAPVAAEEVVPEEAAPVEKAEAEAEPEVKETAPQLAL
jgi:hypothetical protein